MCSLALPHSLMVSPRTLTADFIQGESCQKIQHLPALLALVIHILALLLSLVSALSGRLPAPAHAGEDSTSLLKALTH